MSNPATDELLKDIESPLSQEEVLARVLELAGPADAALGDDLKSHVPFIEEVSRYVIFSGGKRLRPVLFLLCARALGGDPSLRLSAIFEYLHAATLLHDDVVDEAGLRRGRPAARVEYGNDAVILVGDFLFSKSYSLAAEQKNPAFTLALTDCTTYMAEGQVLELLHTGDLDLSLEGYLGVIRAKTAVLLAASCQMGAIAAGADRTMEKALYDYGMELGMAFQMVDDALDYVGTMHEFGKPVGHDLAEGKITLPFIHTRDTAPEPARARLMELAEQGREDMSVLEEAKALVREHGGVAATYERAALHAKNAQAALKPILAGGAPEGDLATLYSLPWYVLARRH